MAAKGEAFRGGTGQTPDPQQAGPQEWFPSLRPGTMEEGKAKHRAGVSGPRNEAVQAKSGPVSDRIGSENLVRCLPYTIGYCHRLHRSNPTGKPELVFPSRRKLIVIHVFCISIPQPTAGSPASPKPTGYAGCRSYFARRHTTQSTQPNSKNWGGSGDPFWSARLKVAPASENG